MTWKLCLGLSLHKSIIQTEFCSKVQTYKQPHKCSLIHPTYSHKCKFSFTYFTSDHKNIYKHTKWQTHSQMSSHTTHPVHTRNQQMHEMQTYTCSPHTFIITSTLVYTQTSTHTLAHTFRSDLSRIISNLAEPDTCEPWGDNLTRPLLICLFVDLENQTTRWYNHV